LLQIATFLEEGTKMADDSRYKKWIDGALFPVIMAILGISLFRSGEFPVERFDSYWFYRSYYYLHGWPAKFLAVGLIVFSLAFHLKFFWSQYPAYKQLSSRIATCATWIAIVLFGIGATGGVIDGISWLIKSLKDLMR
jgi:hypothetical protein